jgi:DNA repair protein RadC
MAITDWPLQERPRERLLALGPASLADAELLAILLRTGARGASAVDLARELLRRFGSISGLLEAPPASLSGTPGLGSAKLAQLKAALELAQRALKEEISSRDALSSPRAVRDYLRLALAGREQEAFLVLLLDAQHRVIASEELFRGTLTQTSVYPREVVKRGGDLRSQPPLWRRRAQPRGRNPHANAQERPSPCRHPGARSFHRRWN